MSSSWWLRAIGFCATISPLCASFSSMYTSSLLYTSMWTWVAPPVVFKESVLALLVFSSPWLPWSRGNARLGCCRP
jgi:hypothetical protein